MAVRIVSVLSFLALVTLAPVSDCPFQTLAMARGASPFQPAVAYDAGGNVSNAVLARDMDGDGKLDLVSANSFACTYPFCSEGNVGILRGNGDGTFQAPLTYGSGGAQTIAVAAGDVNGDARIDIVAANICSSQAHCSSGTVSVLLAQNAGAYEPAVVFSSGGYGGISVALADLNGDGNMDIAVVNRIGGVGVLLGNGNGTFKPAVMYSAGSEYGHSIAIGDVNGDGSLDLVTGSTCLQSPYNCLNLINVLVGNGDGTFQPAVSFDSKDKYESTVTLGDVNGDGRMDLVAANHSGPVLAVLIGNGDATFQPAVTYPLVGVYGRGIALADVNGDGSLDAIVSVGFHPSGATGALGILLGNGDGTFQPALVFESGGSQTMGSADSGDMNGDGTLDIVSPQYASINGGTFANGVLGVLLNAASCSAPSVANISATPSTLWPPNGRIVPIEVSGTIASGGPGCTVAAAFSVTDEYGIVQPSGTITVNPSGVYRFSVPLEASRLGSDRDGRRYAVTVTATGTGGMSSARAVVIVPHDQGARTSSFSLPQAP